MYLCTGKMPKKGLFSFLMYGEDLISSRMILLNFVHTVGFYFFFLFQGLSTCVVILFSISVRYLVPEICKAEVTEPRNQKIF